MAQVEKRIPLKSAQMQARDFADVIRPSCERVEIVGSVRRGRPSVADVEYVVIPKLEARPGPGLFGDGEPVVVNQLWTQLDAWLESGESIYTPQEKSDIEEFGDGWNCPDDPCWSVAKALRGDPERTCWGEKQRAVWFRGMTHEIYLADADNFGSQMVIRTGPAAFSRHVVTELRRCGLKHEGGRVIDCSKAINPVIPTPTEQALFDLIGLKYREPKDRVGVDPDRESNLR